MPRRRAVHAEDLDDLIAESLAQQEVILLALRRIAALTRAAGQDPAEIAAAWRTVGHRGLDKAPVTTAPGHEAAVRANAKRRLDGIIAQGLR